MLVTAQLCVMQRRNKGVADLLASANFGTVDRRVVKPKQDEPKQESAKNPVPVNSQTAAPQDAQQQATTPTSSTTNPPITNVVTLPQKQQQATIVVPTTPTTIPASPEHIVAAAHQFQFLPTMELPNFDCNDDPFKQFVLAPLPPSFEHFYDILFAHQGTLTIFFIFSRY